MKIVKSKDLLNTERQVNCPKGGFTSLRILLEKDGMGFSLTETHIPKGEEQHWHYKNHFEACYCVAGFGILTNKKTGEEFDISKGTTYILDNHDDHTFEAIDNVVLVCVFNPPLKGNEVHREDGSYGI